MASLAATDDILDPLSWADFARSSTTAEDVHGFIVGKLSNLFEVQACGVVSGFKLPPSRSQGQGIPFPDPSLRHGDFLSPEWTEYSSRNGTEDPVPKQIGPDAKPVWLYHGSADHKRLLPGHEDYFQALHEHGFITGLFLSNLQVDTATLDVAGIHSGSAPELMAEAERAHSTQIKLAYTYLCEALSVQRRSRQADGPLLTSRERECLSWTVAGETPAEISDRLHLSLATVNEYLISARRKLGAANRNQACARAVLLGIVSP